jgi:phosphohistidine swiveling domain-containing protein
MTQVPKLMHQILQKIKDEQWANSLTRNGLLQPKVIAVEAIMLPIDLTNGVVAEMGGYIWINNFVAYRKNSVDSLPAIFEQAFQIEPKWPLQIIKHLDDLTAKQKKLLIKMRSENEDISELGKAFKEYVLLLREIMKYYVFAVPLTDYCEKELAKLRFEYSEYAFAYKPLDIDSYNQSLQKIAQSDDKKNTYILKHLKDFAWIKTGYNLIDTYNKDNLSEALKSIHMEGEHKLLPVEYPPVLIGLQCGIFLRNRMKELCQQLWYHFDPIAIRLASYLSLSRDEFFTLTPNEVLNSIAAGKQSVSQSEIEKRQKGFITGFIDKEFFLLTGDVVNELEGYFNTNVPKNILEFKGNVACKGNAKGVVRIIRNKDDFVKFKQGEILVTSMTTPDFILVMKKSAAIITDEGGLSCHAAIMSRELHTPCIIGTRIATKVLKDGDVIEIDTNKGVVKILNKK